MALALNEDGMKINIIWFLIFVTASCSGSINVTTQNSSFRPIKKVGIVKKNISIKIPQNLGVLPRTSDLTKDIHIEVDPIGNTSIHIEKYFKNHGYKTVVYENIDTSKKVDLIIKYDDYWTWDFVMVLRYLFIHFIDPETNKTFAIAEFKAPPFHNFPDSESEVPEILDAVFKKFDLSTK